MSKALYRKYRSKKLSEIVGQEHITKTLENALKSGKISHAYLFTGPRGVGKTSIARILAHEINGLPYTDESIHLDIIEIDAASNRRIDEIRDLRDKVHIAPTSAKYKVYIIDEVHMLTREAFNALLKTLEEPPAHVVFILATTELHKLPETIVSRTQRFTFKTIEAERAVEHLRAIADSEEISIDDEALRLLAEHGRGSFRDSISLLDQVRNNDDTITAADVQRMVGIAASQHIEQLLDYAISGKPSDIMQGIERLIDDGISPAQAAKQLSALIRKNILEGDFSDALTDLLGDLLVVSGSPEPSGALEIALFRANLRNNPSAQTLKASPRPVSQTKAAPKATIAAKPTPKPEPYQPTELKAEQIDAAPEPAPLEGEANIEVGGELADWWNDVLLHIKTINNTLYGVLRMAHAQVQDDTLHLSFGFGFHKKKVADPTTQAKIHEAIQHVTGKSYAINPVHNKNMTKDEQTIALKPTPAKEPAKDELSSISTIFGGAEVLES